MIAVRSVILISTLIFFSSFSKASSCSEVRLNALGKAFAKIPVYNQAKYDDRDDANICYAIAAAELRDARRFARGDKLGLISSPISIALNYKVQLQNPNFDRKRFGSSNDDGKKIEDGSPMAALYLNNTQSVCDQNWLENLVSLFDKNKKGAEVSVRSFISNLTYQYLQRHGMPPDSESRATAANVALTDHFNCRRSEVASVTELFNDIAKAVSSEASLSDMVEISHAAIVDLCKGHTIQDRMPEPNVKKLRGGIDPGVEAALRNELDKNLDFENPVGIGYCHESLQSDVVCGIHHASVVIGRKLNHGKCEYLVRDSYGEECNSRFHCDKDGSIWVPASELAKTVGLTYVIPK